jgi:hypothetical protein
LVGLASWSLVVQLGGEADAWQRAGESALATAVLSNQPNAERSASAEAAAEPVATATPPLEVNDTAEPRSAEPAGSSAALAELTVPNRAASNTPAAPAAERTLHAASEPTKPVAAHDSVGVFVATRAQSNDVPSSPASPPAASPASASPLAASAVEHSPGDTSSVSASSAGVTSSAGAVAHADTKKEPSADSSGMGALLVETPSF